MREKFLQKGIGESPSSLCLVSVPCCQAFGSLFSVILVSEDLHHCFQFQPLQKGPQASRICRRLARETTLQSTCYQSLKLLITAFHCGYTVVWSFSSGWRYMLLSTTIPEVFQYVVTLYCYVIFLLS